MRVVKQAGWKNMLKDRDPEMLSILAFDQATEATGIAAILINRPSKGSQLQYVETTTIRNLKPEKLYRGITAFLNSTEAPGEPFSWPPDIFVREDGFYMPKAPAAGLEVEFVGGMVLGILQACFPGEIPVMCGTKAIEWRKLAWGQGPGRGGNWPADLCLQQTQLFFRAQTHRETTDEDEHICDALGIGLGAYTFLTREGVIV
jgi:hypothetical protein